MKKRLLSAVLALVLCAYPAMAADFGTLTISSDREVIDDSVLYELAETDEPSTLTLRTPDGETGSLTFDGTEYHLQPCGQTDEFTYPVLFSADGENAEGRVEFDPEKLATIPEKDRRWAWLEIDLNAIRHNASAVKKMIGSGRHMMAVVKADAYGHGAVRVAKTALNSGADDLGVATVDEGIKLR